MTSPTAQNVRKARSLRQKMSLPEVLLWRELRKRPGDLKFRRQHPVEGYVADFYCPSAKLVIEIDGEAHERTDRPARDEICDTVLSERGIRTLRIPAKDVLKDIIPVIEHIVHAATVGLPLHRLRRSPSPPLRGREDFS